MSFCFSSICAEVLVHRPPSGTCPGCRSSRGRLGGVARVAVAQRDDVVAVLATFIRFDVPMPCDVADDGDVHRVAGRLEARAEHVARHDRDPGRGGGGAHELALGNRMRGLLLVGHRVISRSAPSRAAGWCLKRGARRPRPLRPRGRRARARAKCIRGRPSRGRSRTSAVSTRPVVPRGQDQLVEPIAAGRFDRERRAAAGSARSARRRRSTGLRNGAAKSAAVSAVTRSILAPHWVS